MRLATLTAAAFLLASGSALADDKDKKGVDCSPGFWKNHTEVWFGLTGLNDQLLLDEMVCEGCTGGPGMPSPGQRKNEAAAAINAWAAANLAENPCPDE